MAGNRGRRRAPKRRRRTSPVRGLVTVVSAVAVVATGVGIAWATHMAKSTRDTGSKSPGSVLSQQGVGDASTTAQAGAKGALPASPTSKAAKKAVPSGVPSVTTATIVPSAMPSYVKAGLKLPKATGPGTVKVISVPSVDTDRTTREVDVYRPAVPANVVLPVVYFLHGLPGEASTMIETVKPALDAAFTTGGLAPFEVVAPTGSGDNHNDTEWADAADGGDLIESYFIKNVIPAVEGATPRPANQRGIVGFSMGGYGAANLALRHPDLFGQFAALAGYFHIDDPSGMFNSDPDREAANNPDLLVQQAAGRRALLIEDADESDPLISGEASEFATRLENCKCNVDVNWRIAPGGHDYDFVAGVFPSVVKFFDAGF